MKSLVFLSILAIGCDDTKESGEDTTTTETEPVMGECMYLDFQTGDPVEGATVEVESETYTTDSDGYTSFMISSNADMMIKSTKTDYPDLYHYGQVGEESFAFRIQWSSTATLDQLAQLLGNAIDSSKAIVIVTLNDYEFNSLPGATVDIDQSYDLVLVPDNTTMTGLSEGNTTKNTSSTYAIFVNVPAGEVQATISGFECSVSPANVGDRTFVAEAGAIVNITYACE